MFIRGKTWKKKKLKSWGRGVRASSQNDFQKAAGRAETFPATGLLGPQAPAGCRDPPPAQLTNQEELPQATPMHEPFHKLIQHYPKIHQASCPHCADVASDGPMLRSHLSPKDTTSTEADEKSCKATNSLAAAVGVSLRGLPLKD